MENSQFFHQTICRLGITCNKWQYEVSLGRLQEMDEIITN